MYETLISVDELSELLKEGETAAVIVDCRFSLANTNWGRQEYRESHIPGAVYADVNQDLSAPVQPGVTGRHPLPDRNRFVAWVQEKGISNRTQVIAYDQGGGGMAARLWWLMRWAGHEAIAVLDGGWSAWCSAGLQTESSVRVVTPSVFTAVFRDDLIVNADEVSQWCLDEQHVVVDSREARRFSGEEETIDPVAGHIPGAVSRPFGENLRPDGKWRSQQELRNRFQSLLETRSCENVAFYCGSGVTACHNILAFRHAGLGDARLYPGSWSEWITDSSRRVETGP